MQENNWNKIDESMGELIMFVGIPASGKSTASKEYEDKTV